MKIGFIGCGNMATALLLGINKSKVVESSDIFVSNRSIEKLSDIKEKINCNITQSNDEVIKNASDIIFICVKPQIFDVISEELKSAINENQLIVSIMAGKSIDYIKEKLGLCASHNVIRVMPNTGALVSASMTTIAFDSELKKDEKNKNKLEKVFEILKSVGELEEVEEKYIDIATQICGASPAFTFIYIEALADAGVYLGLPRDSAYKFAKNAVLGASTLAIKSDKHVASLKDMVTSPAGTTISGVRALEKGGFRSSVFEAVVEAYERAKKL